MNEERSETAIESAVQQGSDPTWLEPAWKDLVETFRELGPVRVTTRNRAATISKTGVFEEVSFDKGPVGLVVGDDIDLRLFTQSWEYGWAKSAEATDREFPAIRVVDGHGRSVFSVELTEASDRGAYRELLEAFETDRPEEFETEPVPEHSSMPVSDVDGETVASFREAWEDLDDPHQFHGILEAHGLDRRVALEVAPEGRALRRETSTLEGLLSGAEEREIPLMLFVANDGCVQIHSDPVTLEEFGEKSIRVGGATLEMEVRADRSEEVWVVEKPTEKSHVTSVEVFDDVGDLAFQVFGERKPGRTERDDWRELVADRVA